MFTPDTRSIALTLVPTRDGSTPVIPLDALEACHDRLAARGLPPSPQVEADIAEWHSIALARLTASTEGAHTHG